MKNATRHRLGLLTCDDPQHTSRSILRRRRRGTARSAVVVGAAISSELARFGGARCGSSMMYRARMLRISSATSGIIQPFGNDEALLLLPCRPVLLPVLQPMECLRQYLVAVAAQPLDVNPFANRADGPVAAVAGCVLHNLEIVNREGEAGAAWVGAHFMAVGGTTVVDAARQCRFLLIDIGLAPHRHFGGMRDDRPGDAAGKSAGLIFGDGIPSM